MRIPNIAEFLLASRYALLPWLVFGLWVYGEVWPRLNTENRNILVLALIVWVAAWIKASFKVFPYEQERRQRRLALLDPEEAKAKQRIAQWRLVILISIGIVGYSFWWLLEQSPDENPQLYLIAAGIVLLFSLGGLFIVYRQSKHFFTTLLVPFFRKPEGAIDKTHVVTWSQPTPSYSSRPDKICNELPQYCKTLIEQHKPG